MRKLFIPLAIASLLLFSIPVFAAAPPDDQPGNMPPGPPGGGRGMSILNFAGELNLTGEQFEKLKAIEKESSASQEKIFKETRSLMEEMRNEADKDKPDEKKLEAIIDKISANHKIMLTSHVHNMIKIRAVLTKEQEKLLKEHFKKDIKKMKNGPPGMPGEERPF